MEEKDEMPKCMFCGSVLIQDDSQMCDDISDDYQGDTTAMVHYSHCPRCGRSYEVVDPPKDERESDYKEYWDENG